MTIRVRTRSWVPIWLTALLVAAGGCGPKIGFLAPREEDGAIRKVSAEAEADGESLILRADGFKADPAAAAAAFPAEVTEQLEKARDLYRRQEYARAESLFSSIADRDKNPPLAIQEAMYYHAECLRLQGYFPKAADVYSALLSKFPGTTYREQCTQHLYEIAYRWLDDTRELMKGESGWWSPASFVSFERSKPLLDREGRAIEKLEQVRLNDVNGPLADRALFLCGVVKMYNEDYRSADQYFEQIYKRHPESPLTPKALELGIQCKHLSTGGSAYDGRKTAEARNMVSTALRNYPQLSGNKEMREYLERQMGSIDVQQAEKEFEAAEFYRRTGRPGSAYFYYELVRRRYPNTLYARKAEERWNSLRAEIEREQGAIEQPAPQAQPQQQTQPQPPGQLPASIRQ